LLSMFSDGTRQALRRTAMLAAAAVMLGSYATASRAEEPNTAIHVRYGDLNLATPEGVQALRRRIRWAAETGCGTAGGLQDITTHARYQICVSTASSKALEKVQMQLAQVQYTVK